MQEFDSVDVAEAGFRIGLQHSSDRFQAVSEPLYGFLVLNKSRWTLPRGLQTFKNLEGLGAVIVGHSVVLFLCHSVGLPRPYEFAAKNRSKMMVLSVGIEPNDLTPTMGVLYQLS